MAGPGGGSEEKPVGTVWIATASPDGVKSKMFRFGNHRGRNIQKSALMALDLLRREIQKFQG
ncbi:MAG: CinA family protein [Owenweeksia sp.]